MITLHGVGARRERDHVGSRPVRPRQELTPVGSRLGPERGRDRPLGSHQRHHGRSHRKRLACVHAASSHEPTSAGRAVAASCLHCRRLTP
jgi:hypothetical protein